MTGYVVDASVVVKWLVDEEHSERAVRLLDAALPLVAPELVFAEAANALWALCRRGDISRADFTEAVDVLKGAPIALPVSMRQLAASAGRLAVTRDTLRKVSARQGTEKQHVPDFRFPGSTLWPATLSGRRCR